MSNFKFATNSGTDPSVKVYARPKSIEAGRGDEAVAVIEEIYRELENELKVKNNLTKVDAVELDFVPSGLLLGKSFLNQKFIHNLQLVD